MLDCGRLLGPSRYSWLPAVVFLFAFNPFGAGAPAVLADDGPAKILTAPLAVSIEPTGATLTSRRDVRQLIANGQGPDGNLQDLTRLLTWTSLNPEVATVSPTGRVLPVSDGLATIVVQGGSLEARTTVEVSGMGNPDPASFRHDVIPALSRASCNMGACHGTPTGKGGFRLSLRGYLPDEDFLTLSREAGGRRINSFDPDASMILRKPIGELPHEGGKRLERDTKTFEFLHAWIAEGAQDDSADLPAAVKLELLPGERVLHAPADTQQAVVLVHYADGTVRDVTELCYYDSSSPDIAEVDADGFVQFVKRGEIALIAHYLDLVATVRLTHLVEVPGFVEAEIPQGNVVDEAVFAQLNRMRIAPSENSTDEEFIRRVYLDAIGVLPTPEEVQNFLDDPSPSRREVVIDALLERPEFHDYWALKFADILRSNARLIKPKGALAFHRWIQASLQQNKPIDEFVRELITADGSTYKTPEANYYRISRDPDAAVETTAQLFLGVRIQCAKCHNHPFEKWTQDDYYGFAAFFSRVKQKPGTLPDEEIIFAADTGEVKHPRTGSVIPPKAIGGPVYDDDSSDRSRRARLAEWLTGPDNPFFAKIMVNRVWYHLLGKGVVDPVDDFRDSNPASNDALLDGLAEAFVSSGYDLKALVRLILNSQTYQLSARTNDFNAEDEIYFSHAYARLLPAEVLLDAVSSFTDTPTAFKNLPAGTRATQIPDGQIEDPFLKTFGRPAREIACECERETDSNLAQALQLIGGETVHNKLRSDNGRIAQLAKSDKTAKEITEELYRVGLSRDPTPEELEAATKHLEGAAERREAVEDLGWVLINSKEFLFRH